MADPMDYLLEAAFGVLRGGERAYSRFSEAEYKRRESERKFKQEEALTRKKIDFETEGKLRFAREAPYVYYDKDLDRYVRVQEGGKPVPQPKLEKLQSDLLLEEEARKRLEAGEKLPAETKILPAQKSQKQSLRGISATRSDIKMVRTEALKNKLSGLLAENKLSGIEMTRGQVQSQLAGEFKDADWTDEEVNKLLNKFYGKYEETGGFLGFGKKRVGVPYEPESTMPSLGLPIEGGTFRGEKVIKVRKIR